MQVILEICGIQDKPETRIILPLRAMEVILEKCGCDVPPTNRTPAFATRMAVKGSNEETHNM
jgi:hypothetical protein